MGESNATLSAEGGTVGGRYRLLSLLGEGTARVWLAHDDLLDREVAVKEVDTPPDAPSGQVLTIQLDTMREVRAAAGLDHRGIVGVLDVVWSPGRSWVVMEYVPSRSLHDVIHQDGPLGHRAAAQIGSQVLDALRAAHDAGILHHDVTPRNVLVGTDGRVVLGGFGLTAPEGLVNNRAEPVTGSPHFLAPELLDGGVAGAPADLWSLGATLYAAVEGRTPFVRATTAESVAARRTQPPDPVERPGPLHSVIATMLARNPAARMTAAQAETELRRVAERAIGVSTVNPRPAAVGTPATPTPGRPPAVTASAMAPPVVPVGAAAGRRPARSTRIAVGSAAVVLVSVVTAALALDSGGDRTTPAATPSTVPVAAAAAVCAEPGSAATPVSSATNPQYDLPEGWLWHEDPKGFRMAMPQGWTRFTDGDTVCFRDPDGARTFGVDTGTRVTRQPLAHWQSEERTAVADGTLPGYRKVAMGVVMLRAGGADWEYTITAQGRARQHVRRLLLNVDRERAYVLSWTTSDQDWSINEAYQRLMVASFS